MLTLLKKFTSLFILRLDHKSFSKRESFPSAFPILSGIYSTCDLPGNSVKAFDNSYSYLFCIPGIIG
jgi:hypothetical protein